MSSGLWDKGFLRPLCSTPQGLRSPGAPPRAAELGSVALAPRLRAWGRSHLLALELASAEGTLTHSAPSSPGSILPFGHTAAPCPQQLSQRQPTLPAAQPPPGSLPSCPARCLLSLCPSCVVGSSSTGESKAQGRAAALPVDGTVLLYRC